MKSDAADAIKDDLMGLTSLFVRISTFASARAIRPIFKEIFFTSNDGETERYRFARFRRANYLI
jgi:hypothetical protein